MGFAEAIKSASGQYAGFGGRARRSEFWFFAPTPPSARRPARHRTSDPDAARAQWRPTARRRHLRSPEAWDTADLGCWTAGVGERVGSTQSRA
jgi:hypothetical protein